MKQKQTMMLKAQDLLKYFLGTNEKLDTLIMCKPNNIELYVYDQSLYEAIGSLKPEEKDNLNKKITKLLEVCHIISFMKNMKQPRKILKQERVDELRGMIKDDNPRTIKKN